MMLAAILSVTTMAIVAFVIGFVCGQSAGRAQAQAEAFNRCMDYAALALKGNPVWRRLTPAEALHKAATLIGGDAVPVADLVLLSPLSRSVVPNPAFTKGNQV